MTRVTSTRFGVSHPDPALRDEPADLPGDIALVVAGLENAAMYKQDTFANRGSASKVGRLFEASDTGQIYWDTGSTWVLIGPPGADSIDASLLAPNSVGASELADNAVDTAAILANAVTASKIPDASLGFVKLLKTWPGFLAHGTYTFVGDRAFRAFAGFTEDYDNGNTFSSNTFTAPTTGVYLLSGAFSTSGVGAQDSVGGLAFYINNASVILPKSSYLPYWDQAIGITNTVIAKLTSGDTLNLGGFLNFNVLASTVFSVMQLPLV